MCDDDKPYRPNKYTRYVDVATWRRIVRGESGPAHIVDPGYVNEPGEEPRIGKRLQES